MHVIFSVVSVYFLVLLIFQFQSYMAHTSTTQTALGFAETRYQLHQQMTELIAKQWEQLHSTDNDQQRAFLTTWVETLNIVSIVVYKEDGTAIVTVPQDANLKSVLQRPGHHIISTAYFSTSDQLTGYLVVTADDSDFIDARQLSISKLFEHLFSVLVLGMIAGVYLTRTGLKLLYTLRETKAK